MSFLHTRCLRAAPLTTRTRCGADTVWGARSCHSFHLMGRPVSPQKRLVQACSARDGHFSAKGSGGEDSAWSSAPWMLLRSTSWPRGTSSCCTSRLLLHVLVSSCWLTVHMELLCVCFRARQHFAGPNQRRRGVCTVVCPWAPAPAGGSQRLLSSAPGCLPFASVCKCPHPLWCLRISSPRTKAPSAEPAP